MAVTAWMSPSTIVSDNSSGIYAWSNPSNAGASDNNYAISTLPGDIIEQTIKLVKAGSVVGDNKSTGASLPDPEAYIEYGGTTDVWGVSLSAADVNSSTFGVVFQVYDDGGGSGASHYLKATNFGFAIPTGVIITGIEVSIEQYLDYLSPNYLAVVDHIRMRVTYEDYGIRISKAGTSATTAPTLTTKKNYIILSTDSVHKVAAQAVVSADSNIAHGLGFAPMFDSYVLTDSLTVARPGKYDDSFGYWDVSSDATYLYCDEIWSTTSLFYIIYLDAP